MPYVPADARDRLDPPVQRLADEIVALAREDGHEAGFAGYLNYACTRLALKAAPERRYWSIAIVVGVMRNVADEFYRRIGVPYEEQKRKQYGDVYDE